MNIQPIFVPPRSTSIYKFLNIILKLTFIKMCFSVFFFQIIYYFKGAI